MTVFFAAAEESFPPKEPPLPYFQTPQLLIPFSEVSYIERATHQVPATVHLKTGRAVTLENWNDGASFVQGFRTWKEWAE